MPLGRSQLVAFAVCLAACHAGAAEDVPLPAPAISASPDAPPPRRPTLRHYLARTEERCEIYSVERDVTSAAERTPCPEDLEVGERIRVTGKTCMREGQPARVRPVVCPSALLRAATTSRDGGV